MQRYHCEVEGMGEVMISDCVVIFGQERHKSSGNFLSKIKIAELSGSQDFDGKLDKIFHLII
jgi:hypothetical protein